MRYRSIFKELEIKFILIFGRKTICLVHNAVTKRSSPNRILFFCDLSLLESLRNSTLLDFHSNMAFIWSNLELIIIVNWHRVCWKQNLLKLIAIYGAFLVGKFCWLPVMEWVSVRWRSFRCINWLWHKFIFYFFIIL